MKKLLAILGALGLTATGASSVVACNNNKKEDTNDLTKSFESLYKADAFDDTALAKWGLTKNNDKYDFTANTLDESTVTSTVTLKDGAVVKQLVKNLPATPAAENDIVAQYAAEDQSGITPTNKTITLSIKLTEFKAVKKENVLSWEDTKVTMTVTIQISLEAQQQDISKLQVQVPDQQVGDPASVTSGEATTAQDAVKTAVAKAIKAVSPSAVITTDYTIEGLDNIKAEDLSGGVKLKVQAVNGSKLLIGTSPEFTVKFVKKSDQKTDISGVTVANITQTVADNTNITGTEATAATDEIKAKVQEALDATVPGTVLNTDYTIDGMDKIVANADVSTPVNLTIKSQAASTKITGDSRTFTITFNNAAPTKKDISGLTITVDAQTVADNTNITAEEANTAVNAIKAAVQAKIDAEVSGTALDTDYTIDGLDQIVANADVSAPVQLTVKSQAASTKITGDTQPFTVTFNNK
ncbi:lipoprotein [Spiroplasma sp. DGKH1]|uniref:lipoprotein n=1 Tax=Spiroplasma sp. DGKH1 TaxID=3050074 RepID=UPI0034C5F99A